MSQIAPEHRIAQLERENADLRAVLQTLRLLLERRAGVMAEIARVDSLIAQVPNAK